MRMRKILGLGLMAIFAIALVLSVSPPAAASGMCELQTNDLVTEPAAPATSLRDGLMAINDTATDVGRALDLSNHYMILNDRDSGGWMTMKKEQAPSAHRASGQYRGDLSASVTLNHTRAYRV